MWTPLNATVKMNSVVVCEDWFCCSVCAFLSMLCVVDASEKIDRWCGGGEQSVCQHEAQSRGVFRTGTKKSFNLFILLCLLFVCNCTRVGLQIHWGVSFLNIAFIIVEWLESCIWYKSVTVWYHICLCLCISKVNSNILDKSNDMKQLREQIRKLDERLDCGMQVSSL